MSKESSTNCPRCGSSRPAAEPLCAQCALEAILEAGFEIDGDAETVAIEEPGPSSRRQAVSLPDGQAAEETGGGTIGRYRLLEPIGEGGFGVVYRARQDEPVKREVALKVIKPGMDSEEVIRRFEAERQALTLMNHPGIANVFDAGTTETGRPYFVMELVEGQPVTRYCDERKLGLRRRLELFRRICEAVQHAHQKGVIHRDLKPTNILVAEIDGKPAVKIIDFGIAKSLGQDLTENPLFTVQGQVMGTPQYMSPEQADVSVPDVDTRSDVYSLGIVLYELLAGRTPFDRERIRKAGIEEVLRLIREEEPPKPSTRLSKLAEEEITTVARAHDEDPEKLTRRIRGDLDWIVMKALEKERERRYETASEFSEDIRRYLEDEAVLASPPSAVYRMRKFARRNRKLLSAAAVIVVTLIAATGVSTWQAVAARDAQVAEGEQRVYAEGQSRLAEKKAEEAESSANSLRHQLALSNLDRADYFFGSEEPLRALGHLSEALRLESGDLSVARRAFSMIERRRWFIPDRVVASGWETHADFQRINGEHDQFQDAQGRWLVVEETRPAEVTLYRVKDLVSGRPIGLPVAAPPNVSTPDFALSPRADLLAVKGKTLWIYDLASGSLRHKLPGDDDDRYWQSRRIQLSPDSRFLHTGKRIWSTQTGELIAETPEKEDSVSFGPAGEKVVIVDEGKAICRALDGWAKLFEIEDSYAAKFTRDGRFVLVDGRASGGRTFYVNERSEGIRIHSAEDGRLLFDPQTAYLKTESTPTEVFEGPLGKWWLLVERGRVWFCQPDSRGEIGTHRSLDLHFKLSEPPMFSPNGRYSVFHDEKIQNVRVVDLEQFRGRGRKEIRAFGQGIALAKPDDIPSLDRVFFPSDGSELIAHYHFSSYSTSEDTPTYVAWKLSRRPLNPELIPLPVDRKESSRITVPYRNQGILILDRWLRAPRMDDADLRLESRVHVWRPGMDEPDLVFESPNYCWLSPNGVFLLAADGLGKIAVFSSSDWSKVGSFPVSESLRERLGPEDPGEIEQVDQTFRRQFAAAADGSAFALVTGEKFEGPEGEGEKIRLYSGGDVSLKREFDFYFQPTPTLPEAGGKDLTLIVSAGVGGAPPPAIQHVYFDSDLLSVVSNRGYIQWHPESGNRIVSWPLRGRRERYWSPVQSPDRARYLAEASFSNLLVFAPQTGETQINNEFDDSIESGQWSPAGRWFAAVIDPGTLQIWDSRDWSASPLSWRFGSSLEPVDVQVSFSEKENLALIAHGDWHEKTITVTDLEEKYDLVTVPLPDQLQPIDLGFLPGETGYWIVSEEGIRVHQLYPDALEPSPQEIDHLRSLIEILAGATFSENVEMRAIPFDQRVQLLQELRATAKKPGSGMEEFASWFLGQGPDSTERPDRWGSLTIDPAMLPVWRTTEIRNQVDRRVAVAGLVSEVVPSGEPDSHEIRFAGTEPSRLVTIVGGISEEAASWTGRWIEVRGEVAVFGDQIRLLSDMNEITPLDNEAKQKHVPTVRNLSEIHANESQMVEVAGTISSVSPTPRGGHLRLLLDGLDPEKFQLFIHEDHRGNFTEIPAGPVRIFGRVWKSREIFQINLSSPVQIQPQ